jgi:hypothetical protein
MNVYEVVKKLRGEIVANVAQVRMGSEYVIIAKHNGVDFEFPEEGRQLAMQPDVMPNVTAVQPAPAKKRGRPPKAQVVESNAITVDEQFDSIFEDVTE